MCPIICRVTSSASEPTTTIFSSALPSSTRPRLPNMRPKPEIGSRREKSGSSACGLKIQPPTTSGETTAAATDAPSTGPVADRAVRQACPNAFTIAAGSSSWPQSTRNASRSRPASVRARPPPTNRSVALVTIVTAAEPSSRERATSPRSRASVIRFSVGSRDFSAPDSLSDIARYLAPASVAARPSESRSTWSKPWRTAGSDCTRTTRPNITVIGKPTA